MYVNYSFVAFMRDFTQKCVKAIFHNCNYNEFLDVYIDFMVI